MSEATAPTATPSTSPLCLWVLCHRHGYHTSDLEKAKKTSDQCNMLFLARRGTLTPDSESTPSAGRVNNGWSSVSAGGDGDYSCGGVSQVLQNVPASDLQFIQPEMCAF